MDNRILAVNSAVNGFSYSYDVEQYSMSEFWERIGTTGTGDCEDYALEKRARLQQMGFECRIAVCNVETGESHAILIVTDLDGSDWILDNRQPMPYTMDEFRGLGYKAVMIQNGNKWEEWT